MTTRTQLIFFALFGLLMFNLSGCGTNVSAGPTGVFVDASTESFLKKAFSETKECGAFEKGDFKDISVIFMPPTFPCKHYASGCSGEYVNPNFLKVGSLYVWKHEVLHFLLDVNTGNPDPGHENALFKNCA